MSIDPVSKESEESDYSYIFHHRLRITPASQAEVNGAKFAQANLVTITEGHVHALVIFLFFDIYCY